MSMSRLQLLVWLLFGTLRANQGSEVLEFVFRDSSSLVSLDTAILIPVSDLPKTVSFSIRPTRYTTDATILSYSFARSSLYIGVRDGFLLIGYNRQIYEYDLDLPLGEWRHIAVVLSHFNLDEVYVDGHRRQRPINTVDVSQRYMGSQPISFFRVGTFLLSPWDTTFPTDAFVGSVAHVQVWGIPLNETQVETLSLCQELQESLNATLRDYLSDMSSWNGSGDVTVRTLEHSELCATKSEFAVITSNGNYEQHKIQCHLLKGTLLRKDSVSSNAVQLLNATHNCVVDDLSVSWLVEEKVRGHKLTDVCSVLRSNGSVSSRPCLKRLPCSVCVTTSSPKFTLFGETHFFDRIYYLHLSESGNISFKGVASSIISREGSQWVLRSSVHEDLWEFNHSRLPIGRRSWVSEGTEKTLALTSCRYLEFGCDDGSCIPIEQRCNAVKECPDKSDEVECKILLEGDVRTPVQKEEINMTFFSWIYNMYDITPEQPILTFYIAIRLSWNDARNVFGNLKDGIDNEFDCESIWTPKIQYFDGYGLMSVHQNISNICFMFGHWSLNKSLTDPHMSMKASGRDITVHYTHQAVLSTPCLFNFARYPFDHQQCNFSILFYPMYGVFRIKDEATIRHFVTRANLGEYKLVNVSLTIPDDFNRIDVIVQLEKLAGYHIATSFAPTLLMLAISLSTYIFPVENFNERIMVSLTSLLVLSALFIQSTEASVKTPNLKLIDIWYAVIILICAFINVSMTAINAMVEREKHSLSLRGKESSSGSEGNQPKESSSESEDTQPEESPLKSESTPSTQRLFTSKLCNQVAFAFAFMSSIVFFIVYYCLATGHIEIQK